MAKAVRRFGFWNILTNNGILADYAIQPFNYSKDTAILDLIEMESPQRSEDLKWKAGRTLKEILQLLFKKATLIPCLVAHQTA
ncbi:hypothetical protein ACFE6N_08670 [Pedobacter sp. BG31]|uniref:hypothetical protein n=1 Tax=Pedobacter sp. BG31 TaxID=3349697 RepID=UPI0035F4E6DB